MIRKILILAIIVMVLMTVKTESAFDLNSGKVRFQVGVLGFTVYDQIKETPLSELKNQFFPGVATEPNWYTINRKSLLKSTEQGFPAGRLLQIAMLLNNNDYSPEQKTTIIKAIWTSLKTQDYQAITQLQQKMANQSAVPAARPVD